MSEVRHKAIASGTAALLPVGALCALFVHVHLDDHDTPHHHGHAIHAHFSEHNAAPVHHDGSRQAIDHDDSEQTLTVQVFVAVSPDVQIAPALPTAPFSVSALRAPAPRPMRQVTHGHDPPLLARLAPRPPPASVI